MTEPKPSNLTFQSRIGKPAKNRRDRTGERFGDWEITGYHSTIDSNSIWFVRNTVTGEETHKRLVNLKDIKKRTMRRKTLDLTGERFGEWDVLGFDAPIGLWECESYKSSEVRHFTHRQLLAFEREAKRREARAK